MSTELLRFRKAFKPAKLATYSSPQRKLWVGRDENSRAREAGDIISNKKLARVKL